MCLVPVALMWSACTCATTLSPTCTGAANLRDWLAYTAPGCTKTRSSLQIMPKEATAATKAATVTARTFSCGQRWTSRDGTGGCGCGGDGGTLAAGRDGKEGESCVGKKELLSFVPTHGMTRFLSPSLVHSQYAT